MTSAIEQRIFIVGAPRSGTTLLQSLLAAHSRAASFTESHFFSRSFRALPFLSSALLLRDPTPRFREFLRENNAVSEAPDAEQRLRRAASPRFLLPLRTKAAAVAFLDSLDALALARGRTVWIEKTPAHLRFTPFLERVSRAPTRFIHLIRDGVDVVSSLHRASQSWERPYDLNECVRRWNSDVAFSLNRADSRADVFLLYERLAADPEPELRRLLKTLGLEWQPEILGRYSEEAERLTTSEETWKTGVGAEIRRSQASRENLSDDQRDAVRRTLRNDLYRRAEQLAT